ncbi:hypothetical protein HYH03_010789 [Edaphochlamys debaryana]|uniref:Uncharacterized protein n=1 Tax=Edaphochlamys debaryana TaxID=47281 RepID=A0A836BVP4_9CHLO|nr:hypothetical protein HYH03_010789 [Edaphochlamys debaryana]|eukprot:KAG2490871.1 hypothetical protein HYH03_010789 [Edaphochlamys debaryana]
MERLLVRRGDRTSPAGSCVVREKDLLPGQQVSARIFAVPASSTDCWAYSFTSSRACRTDRTFATLDGRVYDSCETRVASRDTDGCVKLPGYTFYRGWALRDASAWRVDDSTPWARLANSTTAQQAAAQDMVLMGGRCSALERCVAFVADGNSTDLLYQLPVSAYWEPAPTGADFCAGIYVKVSPPSPCPRIPGYLFTPLYTLALGNGSGEVTAVDTSGWSSVPAASQGPCSDCSDSTALALRCDAYGSRCAGFSNYHGLIVSPEAAATGAGAGSSVVLTEQPLTAFTSTPCAGLFTRLGAAFPSEVEELDQLLCGEQLYCTTQLRYHAGSGSAGSAASGSYYLDLSVDVLSDLALPRALLDPAGGGLPSLPTVRSLTLRCAPGAALRGGLPAALPVLMPFLQELRVSGCQASGGLPTGLAGLRYLRVLDLSANALVGTLPQEWSNMSLGYLNLSSNRLSGALPPAWRGIITPPAATPPSSASGAPPPPPPPGLGYRRADAMMVADLSSNELTGDLDREYVSDTCVDGDLRLQLTGYQQMGLLVAGLGRAGSGRPTWFLYNNPGLAEWAGRYAYAVSDSGYAGQGDTNLCGSYDYKIALGVLWGVFGFLLLCIIAASIWSAVKAARAERLQRAGGGFGFISDMAQSNGAKAPSKCSTCTSSVLDSLDRAWSHRWVRRLTMLVRASYIAADVALDIAVIVWLFDDPDTSSAAVCLAFLLATQVAVSVALLASVWRHFFSSKLFVVVLSPLLVALGPVVGPVLAVANIRNSDVPVVFWRYLELVEFAVALLQAPAESVTQSIVYAKHARMGGGMYVNHGLFIASIILSLGDMLIAAAKLASYKRGPIRRVVVAVTHLDKPRDPVDYRKRLNSSGDNYLEAPLNPPPGKPQPLLQSRLSVSSGAGAPPGGGAATGVATVMAAAAAVSAASMARGAGSRDSSMRGGAGLEIEADAASERLSSGDRRSGGDMDPDAMAAAAAAAAGAHTFTPLTAPRYKPSLLATSSHRLSGAPPGPSPVGPGPGMMHLPTTPSRLGPAGSARQSVASSLTIPAHPPLKVSLPATPTRISRASLDPATPGGNGNGGPGATPTSGTAAAAGAHAALAAAGLSAGPGPGDGGDLSRRSRSLQEGLPQQSLDALHPLVASISSDAGSGGAMVWAATPLGASTSRAASAGQVPMPAAAPDPMRMSRGPHPPAGGGAGSSYTAAHGRRSSSYDSIPPPQSAAAQHMPPSHSPHPTHPESSYLASAAAAAAAALSEAGPGPGPGPPGPGPGSGFGLSAAHPTASAPLGLGERPGMLHLGPVPSSLRSDGGAGPSGARPGSPARMPTTAALQRADSGSGSSNVSPRRREGPSLSIAVPASTSGVQPGQDIQIIRIGSTSLQSGSPLSPAATGGGPSSSPLGPPPQPPHR